MALATKLPKLQTAYTFAILQNHFARSKRNSMQTVERFSVSLQGRSPEWGAVHGEGVFYPEWGERR